MNNERKLIYKPNNPSIISTYLDHVFMGHLRLLCFQGRSSGSLVPEKGAHRPFRSVGVSLLAGLLIWLLVLAFAYNHKQPKLVSNLTINLAF